MADTDLQQSQDPMQQQYPGGGPPPFMTGAMAGAPPAAGGVLPPANPIAAATAAPVMTPEMQQGITEAMQTGISGVQAREAAARGPQLGGQLPGLIQQQQEQSGQLAFHPQFGGGFFHNLGQALMTLAAATTPGHAIENVMYSKPRQEYTGRAEEIASLQKQQELTQQPEGALAGMVYHPLTAAASMGRTEAALQNAATNAAKVTETHSNNLVRQMQGWGRLELGQAKQKFQEWYQNSLIDVARERIAAGMSENEARIEGAKSIASAIQGNKIVQEMPWGSQIMKWVGMEPDIQVPVGGATEPTKPGEAPARPPIRPEASKAAPARPKGVPADAKWNSTTRRWVLP